VSNLRATDFKPNAPLNTGTQYGPAHYLLPLVGATDLFVILSSESHNHVGAEFAYHQTTNHLHTAIPSFHIDGTSTSSLSLTRAAQHTAVCAHVTHDHDDHQNPKQLTAT